MIDKEDEASEIWRAHRRLRRSTFDLDPGSGADDPVIDPALSPGALDPELFYWYNVVGQYVSTEEVKYDPVCLNSKENDGKNAHEILTIEALNERI